MIKLFRNEGVLWKFMYQIFIKKIYIKMSKFLDEKPNIIYNLCIATAKHERSVYNGR